MSTKYYLSIATDPLDSTKFADSSLCDTVREAENFMASHYGAGWKLSYSGLPEVVSCWQYGDSPRWGRIVKSDTGHTDPVTKTKETSIGLSSLVIQLTGNRTAELGSSDKIDIVTPDGNHRFSIDELRMIVKFWDATQTILNEA